MYVSSPSPNAIPCADLSAQRTIETSSAFVFSESSQDPADSDRSQAILIDAVKTTVKIVGLTRTEADVLLHTWARCNARLATIPHDVHPDSVLVRQVSVGWTQFHENLVSWITRKAIESGRGELLMVHGAALSHPVTGAAIVLAAESGTGKTTATQTLAKTLGYVTDETAAFGTDRRLHPYAKPLSILAPSNQRPKTQYSPEDLKLQSHRSDPYVAVVAVLERDRSGVPRLPEAEELPLLEALEELIPQISSLAHMHRGLVSLCQLIDRVGGVVRLSYTESSDLTTLVADLLSKPRQDSGAEWSALDIGVSSAPALSSECYRRVQVDDAIQIGNDTAILIQEEYFVISGIGPTIWQSLIDWKSADGLLNDVVTTHGQIYGAEKILSDQLAILVAKRIIEKT